MTALPGAEAALRVLIVDDEAFARQRMRRLLEAEAGVAIAAECAGGAEAVEAIARERPDAVFLDVQMPRVDGFEVLRRIDPERAPLVVFVTAFDEHALKAFDAQAIDYLLKPVDPERLRVALQRLRVQVQRANVAERHARLLALVRQEFGGEEAAPAAPRPAPAAPDADAAPDESPFVDEAAAAAGAGTAKGSGSPSGDRLLVKADGRMYFVKVAEIDWVEAYGNYARVHVGAKTHLVRETMTHLEKWLEPFGFARIHRSSIVNLDRVKEMQTWFSGDYIVQLTTGARLRLSRWYRDRLEQRMKR